ncbi:MAG: hypothetical protein JJ976_13145 [Rhodothermales bacterium]|nr:hypothetical protein [Rhodothermales bacterium]
MVAQRLASVFRIASTLILLGGWAAPASGQLADTLDGDTIRKLGLVRLGDILERSALYAPISADPLARDGVVAEAGLPGVQSFRVTLDGVPLESWMLGVPHLEMLPVSASRIEHVVIAAPGATGADFSSTGWIHITTKSPGSLRANAVITAGNEVGDPGPFRYTRFATPNIDRHGPSADLAVSGSRGEVGLHGGIRADQAHFTDPDILDRVYVLYDGVRKPRVTLFRPSAGVSWRAHSASFAALRMRDLPFFELMGSELPASRHVEAAQGGGRLESPLGAVHYGWRWSRSRFLPRESLGDLELGWAERSGLLQARLERRTGTVRIALERRRLRGYELDNTGVLTFGGERRSVSTRGWLRRFAGQLSLGSGIRPGLLAELDSGPSPHRLQVRGTFLASPPSGAAASLAAGWDFPGPGSGQALETERVSALRMSAVDVSYVRDLGGRRAGAHAWLRRIHDAPAPLTRMQPDSLFLARYAGTWTFGQDARGTLAGLRIWGSVRAGEHFAQRVSYTVILPAGGQPAVSDRWSTIPRTRIHYALSMMPVPRVHLEVLFRFRSSAEWPHLSDRVPASARLDLTASKDLWGERGGVFARARNVLRSQYRTHPAAPAEDLLFEVGLRTHVR